MENVSCGVPKNDEQVGQLLGQRPPGWEYMLYAGILLMGIERLEPKYSDYSIGYAPRTGSVIAPGDFSHFLKSQLNELQVMVSSLNTLFSAEVMEDAMGPPGVAGNPDKILHAASRIIRLYEDLMLWAERVRGLAMPSEYRRVAELLVRFSDQPINELRNFTQRFAAQVEELPSAIARNEKIVIDEVVTFAVPDRVSAAFDKALKDLMRKL